MASRDYERPQLFILGGFRELTQASSNDGEDLCRYNGPRAVFKQTGFADFIQGSANLQTCSLVVTS